MPMDRIQEIVPVRINVFVRKFWLETHVPYQAIVLVVYVQQDVAQQISIIALNVIQMVNVVHAIVDIIKRPVLAL